MTATKKTDTADAVTYTAHVWITETGSVETKREYKSLAGATKFAIKESQNKAVKEVTILGTDKSRTVVAKGKVVGDDDTAKKAVAAATADELFGGDDDGVTVAKKGAPKKAPRAKREPITAAKAKALKTWDAVLELSDGQITEAFKAGRKPLEAPIDAAKLDRFDGLYLRFLCGDRQTGPSGPRYGSTNEEQKEARTKLRKKIATAAKKAAAA